MESIITNVIMFAYKLTIVLVLKSLNKSQIHENFSGLSLRAFCFFIFFFLLSTATIIYFHTWNDDDDDVFVFASVAAVFFLFCQAGAFVSFFSGHLSWKLRPIFIDAKYISKQKSGYLFNAIILIVRFFVRNVCFM